MSRALILDPTESYTFSKYAELPFDTADLLSEFGVSLKNTALNIPQQLPINPENLRTEIEENLTLVDPSSEMARRESLIFPILRTVCRFIQAPLKIEYPVKVSSQLKGTLDYFIPAPRSLVVVEAKNADLSKGFTQLAVELIALDQWVDSPAPTFYGTVTTGDTWKFGRFHRQAQQIEKDINTYAVPTDLNRVLAILFGITLGNEDV